jgi:FkbM family methyltransferase
VSTTAKHAWLKVLRHIGVKHLRATSGLGLPFICHVGDESGEVAFYRPKHSIKEIALMSAWCNTTQSPVIFDVGANNGFIATQLAQVLRGKNPRIFAFEPVPSTFAQLTRTVQLLDLKDFVFPICAGVSDTAGIVTISYNPHQSLYAQIRNDSLNLRAGCYSTLSATMTIDEVVDSLALKPTLMKIDVEGFEPRVLRGAARLLGGNEPPAVCLEWNPLTLSEVNSSPSELTQSLSNYRFYYIDDFEGQRKPFGEELSNLVEITWTCNLFAVISTDECLRKWESTLAAAHHEVAIPR